MELVLINWGWKRSIFPKLTLHKLTSTWRAFLLIYFYLLLHLVFSRDQNRPCFSASQPGLAGSTGYTWTSKLTVNSHFILESNSKNGRKLRDSKHWMIQYRGETNLHQVDWWSQIEGLAARESLQADAEGAYLLICSVFEMTNSWCQVSSCCISAPIPIQSPTSWSVYGSNCWLLILVNTSQCLQQKWQISEQVENPFIIFFFLILMEPLLLQWGKFPGLQARSQFVFSLSLVLLIRNSCLFLSACWKTLHKFPGHAFQTPH